MSSRRKRGRSTCQQLVYTLKQIKELTGITEEWKPQVSSSGDSFLARVSDDYQLEPRLAIDIKRTSGTIDYSQVRLNGWEFVNREEMEDPEDWEPGVSESYAYFLKGKTQLVISTKMRVDLIQRGEEKGSMRVSEMTKNGFFLPLDMKARLIPDEAFFIRFRNGANLMAMMEDGAVRITDKRYNGTRMKFCRPEKRFSLLHKTSIESLTKIIGSQYFLQDVELHAKNLVTAGGLTNDKKIFSPQNWCGDQFPGVYFRVNFGQFGQDDDDLSLWDGGEITEAVRKTDVWIELSGDLVDRGDFHFNGFDSDGRLLGTFSRFNEYDGQRTYFADEFQRMVVNNPHYGPGSYAKNEIIFHHKVPIKYINNIITGTPKTYERVAQILKNNNLEQQIKLKYLERFDENDSFPMVFTTIPIYRPNYCSCVAQLPYWVRKQKEAYALLKPNFVYDRVISSCADGKVSPNIQNIYNRIEEYFEKLILYSEKTPLEKRYNEVRLEIHKMDESRDFQSSHDLWLKRVNLKHEIEILEPQVQKLQNNRHENINRVKEMYNQINKLMQNSIYTKALAVSIDKELHQDQEEATRKRLRLIPKPTWR